MSNTLKCVLLTEADTTDLSFIGSTFKAVKAPVPTRRRALRFALWHLHYEVSEASNNGSSVDAVSTRDIDAAIDAVSTRDGHTIDASTYRTVNIATGLVHKLEDSRRKSITRYASNTETPQRVDPGLDRGLIDLVGSKLQRLLSLPRTDTASDVVRMAIIHAADTFEAVDRDEAVGIITGFLSATKQHIDDKQAQHIDDIEREARSILAQAEKLRQHGATLKALAHALRTGS